MDSIKKIGEICKQHYEKLVLILALVLLGVAVVWLYMQTQHEKEKIKEFFTDVGRKTVKMVKSADLTNYTAVLEKAKNPPPLELGLPHNLLNPVKWKQTPQGDIIKEIKGTETGLDKLEIVDIRPLNFTIAFERTAGPGYWINVTNEMVVNNRRIAQFATLNNTNLKVFVLRDVKGAPEDPSELVIELKESGERVTITKEKPFVRPEAYQADLRYPLENKTFSKQRVGAQLKFGGEDYKIVTINQNEIVFLGGNDKKYTKRYNPGSTNATPAAADAKQ
jgi:hypothetical protein